MNISGEGLYVGMQRITKELNSQDIIALQKFTGATLGNLLPSFFQEMINCTVQSKPFHSSDRWKNLNRDEKERLAGQILHWHRSLTFIEPSYERKCRYTVEDDQKLKIVFRGSDLKTPEEQTAYIEYLEEVKTDKINEGVDDDFLKWLKRKIENEKERLKPLNNNMGVERHLDSTGSNSNDFIFPGFIINILIDYHMKFDGWIFEEMRLDEFLNVFRQNKSSKVKFKPELKGHFKYSISFIEKHHTLQSDFNEWFSSKIGGTYKNSKMRPKKNRDLSSEIESFFADRLI